MNGAFVSARDYRDYNGFGQSTPDELIELRKALSAGSDINNPGAAPGQGFPLRVESLEATLKNVSFEMDEIKLFKSIPKVPASNTVEEFNRLGIGGIVRSDGGRRGAHPPTCRRGRRAVPGRRGDLRARHHRTRRPRIHRTDVRRRPRGSPARQVRRGVSRELPCLP